MNERIKELAEQAGFGSAWFKESLPGYPALPKECMLKEFAQLIAKETLQVARAGIEFGDGMEDAVYKYFEIEE